MAVIRGVFGGNVIPQSPAAKAMIAQREREAEEMRALVMTRPYMSEMYGPTSDFGVNPEDLMTDPKELQWGPNINRYITEMRRNVLTYASLQEGILDQQATLALEWITGEPGDPESEAAREEVVTAWEANYDRVAMMRGMRENYERGFRIGEMIWDVISRGNVRDLFAPISIIPRPHGWFGFDHFNRPLFTRDYRMNFRGGLEVVPELKIAYARSGDLHTRYGHGTAEDCYPTVFKIDAEMKKLAKITERFGFPPMVVTYPEKWQEGGAKHAALCLQVQSQWKNFMIVSGAVEIVTYNFAGTEGAMTAAGATAQSILSEVRKYEDWLAMFVQGTAYSSGGQQEGSFARDKVASTDRLYKAPSFAAIDEAMLNRCFVRPIMLINRPSLEESKWPRAAYDTSFGEDLAQRLLIYESGIKMGVKVEAVTWAEDFTVRVKNEPGELMTPSATPTSLISPEAQAAQAFAEQRIRVATPHGIVDYPADYPVIVEGLGKAVRAAELHRGQVIVTDASRFRRAG